MLKNLNMVNSILFIIITLCNVDLSPHANLDDNMPIDQPLKERFIMNLFLGLYNLNVDKY